MSNEFKAAADYYAGAFGWATHPLRLDDNGFPKVAIAPGWQNLTPADRDSLPWDRAKGIGIIGGSNSGNLAFIDVDDNELAADIAAFLIRHHRPLMAWTARRRIHIYVQEPEPSSYKKITFVYKGHDATVEFRAQGSYVAASPSPGYTWMNPDWEPLYGSLQQCWEQLVREMPITTHETARIGSQGATGASYPSPWQARVADGQRNQSIYVEAHRLREAGMPVDEAIGILRVRFEKSYEKSGIGWGGLERSIRSAYTKAVAARVTGKVGAGGVGI